MTARTPNTTTISQPVTANPIHLGALQLCSS
jgi:hypothetical protein